MENPKKPANKPPITSISINGMVFTPKEGIKYRWDYCELHRKILDKEPGYDEQSIYRHLLLNDLWFFVYFAMRWPAANHAFIVNACREVEDGPQTQTLDLWFREAGKSTVITIARSIQEVLRDPQERVCIFSYAKSPALSFLRSIKQILETSEFLKTCFPDVLWDNPEKQSPKWSEQEGLTVKRTGFHKEQSFEAHGLLEGMPTGKHFSLLVFDDVVTADLVQTPDMMEKVKERIDVALNVGTADGRHRVIGTFYHHEDPLNYIMGKKALDGSPLYSLRKKPATINGEYMGKSVFLPETRLDLLRGSKRHFYCQQLLDPTPIGEQQLNYKYIKYLEASEAPKNLYKFFLVDPAGSGGVRADGRKADDWAVLLLGVQPELSDRGASNIYIMDGFIEQLTLSEALNRIVGLYMRSGRVLKLGVEKVGALTFEVHVANALRARGKHVSVENGSLAILNPAGRKKEMRIAQALEWPLNNGKIHILSTFLSCYRDRLKMEMDKFPYWRDDGIDILSYGYDIIKDYRFTKLPTAEERDFLAKHKEAKVSNPLGWMAA